MADFGIDAQRVYANDGDTNPAFWTVLPGGVHGQIVAALTADQVVQQAIQAKLADPNNVDKRNFVIDHINRATVNCLGQRIAGQPLQPEQAAFTIYNALDGGTAAAIDSVIGDAANVDLHNAFAAGDANSIITTISRQTGRALFQTCVKQITDFAADPLGVIKSHLPTI